MTIPRGLPYYTQVADALRADIRSGVYGPGDLLPSERELRERFGVSGTTIKSAMSLLRGEGMIVSRQGLGAFVVERIPLRRTDDDIADDKGFYRMLERAGRRSATVTTVEHGFATEEVANNLGVPLGEEVVIRHRRMRAEDTLMLCLATSYFPLWVASAAPDVENPQAHGMPEWLRRAFGETYSEDVVTARVATAIEVIELELEPGDAVLVNKGLTLDQQRRVLHFIDMVVAGDRMPMTYRYGTIPNG